MKVLKEITKDMKANVVYAENQDEYLSLPVHKFENGQVCCCLELSEEELKEVIDTKKLYVTFLTFNQPLQPFYITGNVESFNENVNLYQKDHLKKEKN